RNNADGTFSDMTKATRLDKIMLTMGSNFGDLDNDGYLDFYIGTGAPDPRFILPNRMFRNDAGRVFQEVTASGGFGTIMKGHGVAFGDIDQDGDQDLYVVLGGAYEVDLAQNQLFVNPGHGNNWITLRLQGVTMNRAAIGARIKVSVTTPSGNRDIYSTVGSGGSFGASSLQQEIGLGKATTIRSLSITWSSTGKTDVYEKVGLNQAYLIREGDAAPRTLVYDPVKLGG
ncbi:MAG: CRTAC1 family protein, partial [Proteobacteria bacterium]|nr:CRTAC1 family protein [Pseudomonadota bacterium]